MTKMMRLLCLTTLLASLEQGASLPRARRDVSLDSKENETSTSAPTLSPSPTTTYPPTTAPTIHTNQTNHTATTAPSVAPTNSTNATSEVPTVSPSPTTEGTKAPTTAPTAAPKNETATTAPTHVPATKTSAPTTAPTAVTPPPPAAPHKYSVVRFIEKTIALFIMLVLALLGFGAIMNNRYRIYFFLRGVWYTILGMDCTHWIMRKIGLRSYQPVDGGLNTVIFENEMDEGLLMRETDT